MSKELNKQKSENLKLSIEDFKTIKNVGEGAFGEVYLAKKNGSDTVYALKSIDKIFLHKQKKEHHVFQEKLILTSLEHPSIVKLYGTFQDKSKLYFLMENLPKGELAQYMKLKGTLNIEEVRYITANIVVILDYLRSMGIVHRDLKPENLIFGTNNKLTCIDFGTADIIHYKGVNDDLYNRYMAIRQKYCPQIEEEVEEIKAMQKKHKKSFVGTVYYIAPEMLVKQEVDHGCDLWALGIIIYKMFTGKYLFNEANDYLIFQIIKNGKYEMDSKVPKDAQDLISELLKPKPEDRLGNGGEGSGREMSDLKNHKFFQGINFDKFMSEKSSLEIEEKKEEYMDDSDDELVDMNSDNPFGQKKEIIISGLVKKMKYVLMYNTRQLILYSNGTLEYFDPKNSNFKGKIVLGKGCKVQVKGSNIFSLCRPEREYTFQCVDVPPEKWVKEIQIFCGFNQFHYYIIVNQNDQNVYNELKRS